MHTNRIIRWLLIALVLFAAAGAFATIMTSPLNRNEHMYHAAGVFAARGQILYEDFAYLQTPCLPLVYGALYKALRVSSHYLLIAAGAALGLAPVLAYSTDFEVFRFNKSQASSR